MLRVEGAGRLADVLEQGSADILSGLNLCSHCRQNFSLRADANIGFRIYWVKDFFFFEVVLFVDGTRIWLVLYRDVYQVLSAVKK